MANNFLEQFLNDMKENVPGFIALSVTEIDTGVSLLSHTEKADFDPEIASTFNLEVAKAKMAAISALGLKSKIQDILITLDSQIHIIDMAENGDYFIYLAVDSSKANLGMTRALLKKYKKDVAKNL
ncbi:hypothetical protein [Abyssalbus ytuae]|uniref:Roadblock/LAMTOR2 domain-containing protein n=1 Tax=Abyssalbus ytuae TaxID=2926907 RepID=A0A9E7A0Q2_9FLAO|nr:hypothetical protein [Abyssalbus ytuae]UOB17571.1 hypothetical protein MQE35_17760 [Abyssalbus ytuae]